MRCWEFGDPHSLSDCVVGVKVFFSIFLGICEVEILVFLFVGMRDRGGDASHVWIAQSLMDCIM